MNNNYRQMTGIYIAMLLLLMITWMGHIYGLHGGISGMEALNGLFAWLVGAPELLWILICSHALFTWHSFDTNEVPRLKLVAGGIIALPLLCISLFSGVAGEGGAFFMSLLLIHGAGMAMLVAVDKWQERLFFIASGLAALGFLTAFINYAM